MLSTSYTSHITCTANDIVAVIAKYIRIVLVATTHPGNIGAAARAMKTMGLNRLYLVRPKIFPHVAATARAAGADDILANAVIVDDLRDAISECQLVIGASARQRDLPLTLLDSRAAALRAMTELVEVQSQPETSPELWTKPQSHSQLQIRSHPHEVAFVFGRESNGLHNDELLQCNYHVYIPANPEFSSLNVASAVQIIVYEILMACHGMFSSPLLPSPPPPLTQDAQQKLLSTFSLSSFSPFSLPPTSHVLHDVLATAAEMQAFYEHLEQVLIELGFLRPQKSKRLMTRVQRLFNRARLEHLEANILRGILTAVQDKNKTTKF